MDTLEHLAPGIVSWRAIHPDWNTTYERVACHALRFDDGLLLIDPLLSGTDEAALLAELRAFAPTGVVHAYITLPAHVRDVERALDELGTATSRIYGHVALVAHVADSSRLVDAATATLPFGTQAQPIGSPRRMEMPLYSPVHRALVVGDVAIGVRGGLRIWQDIAGHEPWFRERFIPSIRPLLELGAEHVLVGHGEPVIDNGKAALAQMLRTAPVASIRAELAGPALVERHRATR
ncbi:MAG: fold metallo-hydrolase [Thermoleophilia bacterium]|nr:fold metallo-hydrolase [Thermoleophilia bacterium]